MPDEPFLRHRLMLRCDRHRPVFIAPGWRVEPPFSRCIRCYNDSLKVWMGGVLV